MERAKRVVGGRNGMSEWGKGHHRTNVAKRFRKKKIEIHHGYQ
jgi:hypothetical protein